MLRQKDILILHFIQRLSYSYKNVPESKCLSISENLIIFRQFIIAYNIIDVKKYKIIILSLITKKNWQLL